MDKKKLLVFGASNSQHSINKQFAVFAAHQLTDVELEVVDLNDFELPLYSIDREKSGGVPEPAVRFFHHIRDCDAIVVSFAEHNGLFTAVFKNLWDWMSRIGEPRIWQGKPIFMLCASPGRRREKYVLNVARDLVPAFGGVIVAEFYLRSFRQTFKDGQITNAELRADFQFELEKFQSYINNI